MMDIRLDNFRRSPTLLHDPGLKLLLPDGLSGPPLVQSAAKPVFGCLSLLLRSGLHGSGPTDRLWSVLIHACLGDVLQNNFERASGGFDELLQEGCLSKIVDAELAVACHPELGAMSANEGGRISAWSAQRSSEAAPPVGTALDGYIEPLGIRGRVICTLRLSFLSLLQ